MRRGAHAPIFDPRIRYGTVNVGAMIGEEPGPVPPPVLDFVNFIAPSGIVVIGDYLFTAAPSDGMFYVINKSNPAALGSPAGFGTVTQRPIATNGSSHIFVVGGGEFRSWNVTTPTSPTLAGSTSTGGAISNALGMAYGGNRVYIATGLSTNAVIRNINVTTLTAPTQTSQFNNSSIDGSAGIAFQGSHVYVASTIDDVVGAVNISVPATLALSDTEGHADLTDVVDVAINLQYVYAVGVDGLVVIDKTTPTALSYVTSVSIPNAVGIEVGSDHAYVITDDTIGNGALYILDITTPAAPTIITDATVTGLLGAPRDLVMDDDVLFVTDEGNGAVYAFDVAAFP